MAPISWIGIKHPSYQLQLHHFYLSSAFPFGRGEVGSHKWARVQPQNQENSCLQREIHACRETKEVTLSCERQSGTLLQL